MDILIAVIIALLVGLGAGYWFADKKAGQVKNDLKNATFKVTDGIEAVKSVQYLAFAPIGTAPQTLSDAYDRLWVWAGLEEKGAPGGS